MPESEGANGCETGIVVQGVLCGVILVYLFIEIQPRYRCFAMPFIFLLASVPGAYMTRKKS